MHTPLTLDQEHALIAFAQQHGRYWKMALNLRWATASAGPILQSVRTQYGPSWLASYQLPATPFAAIG